MITIYIFVIQCIDQVELTRVGYCTHTRLSEYRRTLRSDVRVTSAHYALRESLVDR